MKYTCEIVIERPVDRVIELFDNPDNMYEWMPGLQSFEHLSGEPGRPGAKSRLKFKMGSREIEMIESIEVRNLPEEFSGSYEAPGVFNKISNSFVDLGDGTTRWVSENEFIFNSLMMKLMSFFMPGAFRKETMKHLESFKKFAESEDSPKAEEARA